MTENETVVEPVKLSLKSLDVRLKALEDAPSASYDEMFNDLLAAVLESLVRTRSQGAKKTALKLRDKYLDPEVDVAEYGEQYIRLGTLNSAQGE